MPLATNDQGEKRPLAYSVLGIVAYGLRHVLRQDNGNSRTQLCALRAGYTGGCGRQSNSIFQGSVLPCAVEPTKSPTRTNHMLCEMSSLTGSRSYIVPITIKRSGQRTANLNLPRALNTATVPPTAGALAAEALGLKLVAAINGRAFFSKPVPVRYRRPRIQYGV